ncbi:hypothetical protein E2K80_08265 [Rhodophyticola sp. CCM32]|uniref:hypothetical protein n=1 Tax=Rhodophyticola sp. CCM32 TaxID=2916397 RepID=UPI00107F9183|nr:hypothetical protein [Rhodophyticola sp. CCM32]QBY00727.1 hypothetical protein E2K80_08265 [Rhodophyticola sp. CCM32]
MKLTFIKVAGGLVLSMLATTAFADCTQEDIQEKTAALTASMQALAATDPAKMQEIATRMQESMTAAAATGDQEAVCTSLDELIAELDG